MTINKNSVEQINVALLDMDKKIKSAMSNGTSASDFKNLEASVDSIKRALNETKAGLEPGKTYNINISGNAATATKATTAATAETATTAETAINANHVETADKVANALTVNGKTYDGSSAVDAGVQTVANGGTGATDAASGFNTLADGVRDSSTPRDDEKMLLKPTGTWYKTTCLDFWNYIKDKISSVLGLTKDTYGGKANTAGTADKTVNDIDIYIPYVNESGQYVIPLGNILPPGSAEFESPYNWDITGFFSIIRSSGHAGSHIQFEAGHGYSHGFTTYAYLDEKSFTEAGNMRMSIKAFQYNGKWWLGLWIDTSWQGYTSKMTITYSRGLPATPTCILYNSRSNGVANKEIYDSIQDIPSWWWRRRTIHNPTTFTQDIVSPSIKANNKMVIPIGAPSQLEDGCIWIER